MIDLEKLAIAVTEVAQTKTVGSDFFAGGTNLRVLESDPAPITNCSGTEIPVNLPEPPPDTGFPESTFPDLAESKSDNAKIVAVQSTQADQSPEDEEGVDHENRQEKYTPETWKKSLEEAWKRLERVRTMRLENPVIRPTRQTPKCFGPDNGKDMEKWRYWERTNDRNARSQKSYRSILEDYYEPTFDEDPSNCCDEIDEAGPSDGSGSPEQVENFDRVDTSGEDETSEDGSGSPDSWDGLAPHKRITPIQQIVSDFSVRSGRIDDVNSNWPERTGHPLDIESGEKIKSRAHQVNNYLSRSGLTEEQKSMLKLDHGLPGADSALFSQEEIAEGRCVYVDQDGCWVWIYLGMDGKIHRHQIRAKTLCQADREWGELKKKIPHRQCDQSTVSRQLEIARAKIKSAHPDREAIPEEEHPSIS